MNKGVNLIMGRLACAWADSLRFAGGKEIVWAKILFMVCFLVLVLVTGNDPAHAFTLDAQGSSVETGVKSVFFGGWGFVFGAVILFIAIFTWIKLGAIPALGVMLAGVFFFLIPAFVDMLINLGKGSSPN